MPRWSLFDNEDNDNLDQNNYLDTNNNDNSNDASSENDDDFPTIFGNGPSNQDPDLILKENQGMVCFENPESDFASRTIQNSPFKDDNEGYFDYDPCSNVALDQDDLQNVASNEHPVFASSDKNSTAADVIQTNAVAAKRSDCSMPPSAVTNKPPQPLNAQQCPPMNAQQRSHLVAMLPTEQMLYSPAPTQNQQTQKTPAGQKIQNASNQKSTAARCVAPQKNAAANNHVIDLDSDEDCTHSRTPMTAMYQYDDTSPNDEEQIDPKPAMDKAGGYKPIFQPQMATVYLSNLHVEIHCQRYATMCDWVPMVFPSLVYTFKFTAVCDKLRNRISELPKNIFVNMGMVAAADPSEVLVNPKTKKPAILEEQSAATLTLDEETMTYCGETEVRGFYDTSYAHSRKKTPNFRLKLLVFDALCSPLWILLSEAFSIKKRNPKKSVGKKILDAAPRKRGRACYEDENEKPRKSRRIQKK